MTTNREPRGLRRQANEGNGSGGGDAVGTPITDRLRLAREARGVDLYRVERDTKIRVKYLQAMEQGLFTELPADVYARGFLRNYASYLGLDPDEAESEWRRGNFTPAVKAPPAKTSAARTPATMAAPAKPPVSRAPAAAAPLSSVTDPTTPAPKTPGFRLPGLKWPSSDKPETGASAEVQSAGGSAESASAAGSIQDQAGADAGAAEGTPMVRVKAFMAGIGGKFRRPKNEAPPLALGGPQPIIRPRRSFVFQPIHLVLLMLVVIVVAVLMFFGHQADRVLRDPTVSVSAPAQALTTVPTGTTTYHLAGVATGGTEINISWDGRDPTHATADASGNWAMDVALHNGNNQFDVWSTDLDTTHNSPKVVLVIEVQTPTASPVPEYLAVNSPLDGQYFQNGSIVVSGTTVAITSVTITPTYLGIAPGATPVPKPTKTPGPIPTAVPTLVPLPTATPPSTATPVPAQTPAPAASGAPQAVTVIPTVDGKFTASLSLYSGRWSLSVVGTNTAGVSSTPVKLTVIVTAGSLVVVIDVRGGAAFLKVWKDGKVIPGYPHNVATGASVRIVADQSVWIHTGAPSRTYVTVNGISYGRLGGTGSAPGSWRMTAYGPPTPSTDS